MEEKLLTPKLFNLARDQLDHLAQLSGYEKTDTLQTRTYSWELDARRPRLQLMGAEVFGNVMVLRVLDRKTEHIFKVCPAEMYVAKPGRQKTKKEQ